jgi:hypothetical protein
MTKASAARIERRRRGRPSKDDQIVVDVAAALTEAYSLGPQQARDLALAVLEGKMVTPSKLPRGAGRRALPHSVVMAYELPFATFKGRQVTILQKIRSGKLRPRRDVVVALVSVLRAKDDDIKRRAEAALKILLPTKPVLPKRRIFRGSSKMEDVP